MTPAVPVETSDMPAIAPVEDLVKVMREPEESRSSWYLKLVHRSSNFTDCRPR